MGTYLIRKIWKEDTYKYTTYFDWYLNKFIENQERKPLKKLYTKHFNSIEQIKETIKNFHLNFTHIRKDYFQGYQIIEIKE